MLSINKPLLAGVSCIAVLLVMTGCDSSSDDSSGDSTTSAQAAITPQEPAPEVQNVIDVSKASIAGSVLKVTGGDVKQGLDYSYPEVIDTDDGLAMVIPSDPLPAFSARRTVSEGTGEDIYFGDPVTLKYDMFSWTTGELVESSSEFAEAITARAGVSDDLSIPTYLANSMLGRSLGDVLQLVLPPQSDGLPDYLDAEDSYVILVELL